MKKFFIVMCLTLIGMSASAQKGMKAVGVDVSYGTKIKSVGIGVNGQYNFTDAIRGDVSLDYFFKKDGASMWDINANVHYLFPIATNLKVYPLAGFTYTNWKFDWVYEDDEYGYTESLGSSTVSRFGANLGGGIQYDLTSNLLFNPSLTLEIFFKKIFQRGEIVSG